MTQLHLHPYRPEMGDARPMRKLARNYKAVYRQFQSTIELMAASANGRWVALESRVPGSHSVHEIDWLDITQEHHARLDGLHIVTGSMNHGLPAEVLDMMDYKVYVPQFDDVPFLAPVSAAAITLDRIFQTVANKAGVWG